MIGGLGRRAARATRYALGHLRRRDRGLWAFGNLKGFRDNPRYLAEHVLHEVEAVEAWWIAGDEREAEAARRAGLAAAVRGTRAAARVQGRAGAAFLSNGFADLEPDHLGGAFVVDLRHGKGLKRVLLDLASTETGRLGRTREALRRWVARRRLRQVDLIVAPGEMAAEMYRSAYSGPPSRVRVLGTPRFDVIQGGAAFDRAAGPALREELGLGADDWAVLWLPTWREVGDAAWLPRLDREAFDRAVAGTSIVVLVKPHPYSDRAVFEERLPQHPRLRLLVERQVDANCLLRVSEALITDFSSAAFDFALLDRPIHFLVPDVDDYRDGRGLYLPLETLTGGRQHRAWPSLLDEVRASALGEDAAARDPAARIRRLSRSMDAPGSCQRIVEAVAREIGLELTVAVPSPSTATADGADRVVRS